MKTILLIFTGGTISMSYDKVVSKSVVHDNHDELLKKVAAKIENVNLESIIYSLVPSPSITPNDMLEIGKLIEKKFATENISGVVITHGTDTLEETAYFLDLFLNEKKPVVLTGSMRNFDEVGYDGFSNLVSAILVALSPESNNRGVLVCLNDEINSAVEVMKTHTLALDTFKSLEFGPLGLVDEKTVIYYRDATYEKEHIKPTELDKRVEIIKVVSGEDGKIIDFYINEKVSGIIIESLGRGNVPKIMVPQIKKALKHNISVVITSRCPMGLVRDTYAYEGGGYHLKNLGVLSGGSLASEKARLKLMAILSLNLDPKDFFSYN